MEEQNRRGETAQRSGDGDSSTAAGHPGVADSAAMSQAVFAHSAVAMALHDFGGRFIEVNAAFRQLLGYQWTEIEHLTLLEIAAGPGAEQLGRWCEGGRSSAQAIRCEVDLRGKDGAMVAAEIDSQIIMVAGQSLVLSVVREIGQWQEAKKSLEKAALEWATAMDASDDAIYLLDVHRRILRANKAFCQMVGRLQEEIVGLHVADVVHPRGEDVPCPVCRAQEERRDAVVVMEADHPDNPTGRPIQITVKIVRDETGQPLSILMNLHDLSAQRRVEDELRSSKEEWERTFDAMADIVTIQDREMRIVRANRAAHEVFGKEVLSGNACHLLFRGSADPCPGCPGVGALQDGQSHSGVIEHQTLGKVFQVTSSPIVGADGRLEYLVHVAKDITEQRQIEEERNLFGALVDQSNDAIYVVDPETATFLFANSRAYGNLGYSREELLSLTVLDINENLQSPEEWQRTLFNLRRQGSLLFETVQRHKDGTLLPVEINARIISRQGKEFIVSVVRDISERKSAEKQVIEEKNKIEAVLSALGDGLTVQDRDFNILYQNDVHIAMQGNHVGERCYKAYQGRDAICDRCLLLKCFADGKVHRRETKAETDHGTVFLEVSASPLRDSNGEIIGGVETVRDISARKNLEVQVQQAQKMEAIGTLAGGIAHDFNNILSVILGYSEMTKSDLRSGRGTPEENIDQVIAAGKRATELVRQILSFSRQAEMQLKPLSPHLIVKEALKMLRASLPTSIAINQDIDPQCGLIKADPTKIHQVVMNLCTNARHAMENEKGILSVALQRREVGAGQLLGEKRARPGPFVVLTVTDNGHGMDRATVERIFEPYFTTKAIGQGTGLGLAVVHGIVRDLHGFIEVESEPGEGTSFRVYFPALAEVAVAAKAAGGASSHLSGNEWLLVVDDEETIALLHRTALERLGYRVTALTDSEEALAVIRAHPERYAVVITDQTMPGLTGFELAQSIGELPAGPPVILCTGFSAVISEEKAMSVGIKKYLTKPVNIAALVESVRAVLDGKCN